jgi:hypothetical protein
LQDYFPAVNKEEIFEIGKGFQWTREDKKQIAELVARAA